MNITVITTIMAIIILIYIKNILFNKPTNADFKVLQQLYQFQQFLNISSKGVDLKVTTSQG